MSARHMGWAGLRSAMVAAAIVAVGCAGGQKVDAQLMAGADRGFNISVDSDGCPDKATPFGPSDSKCPPGNPDDCLQVTHGNQVRFATPPSPKTDFVIEFTSGSPLADPAPKVTSNGGVIEKATKSTISDDPKKNVFPFKVEGLPTSTCKNKDPQIILN